jgi:hypothetical protein
MNPKKLIEGNFKELIKLYTICFIIYFLLINFIFQITNSLSLLSNVVLLLIPISLKVTCLSVPSKLADNYSNTYKLKYLVNRQNNASTSLI